MMTKQKWLVSTDPSAMLKHMTTRSSTVGHPGMPYISDRKLWLFAVACCRCVWHLLRDERSRCAVEVAELYADGEATAEELVRTHHAAFDNIPASGGEYSNWYAFSCTRPGYSADDNAKRACEISAGNLSLATRSSLLREIVGNPFRRYPADSWVMGGTKPCPQWPDRWLTPTVFALAEQAYRERLPDGTLDPDRLAILADALEESGCTDEGALRHLRGLEPCWSCLGTGYLDDGSGEPMECLDCDYPNPQGWQPLRSPHYRGCHVLDAILGKE